MLLLKVYNQSNILGVCVWSWLWSEHAWDDTDCTQIGRANEERREINYSQQKNTKSK